MCPCGPLPAPLRSRHHSLSLHLEPSLTSPSPAAASAAIPVLIADSNRMQAQLLTSALRRPSEFRIATCPMSSVAILQAVTSKLPRVAVLSLSAPADVSETLLALRRFHLE